MERVFYLLNNMRLSKPALHSDNNSWICFVMSWKLVLMVITLKDGHTLSINEWFLSTSTWGFCASSIFQSLGNTYFGMDPSRRNSRDGWTLLMAFRANKLPVHSAGLSSSSSAFHLFWGRHCWRLQVWCLCYHSRNDFVRSELRLVNFAHLINKYWGGLFKY